MVSPEHIHTSDIVQIQQVLTRAICLCHVCAKTYMNVITVSEERTHVFEAFGERGFGERRRKGRKKRCNYILASKMLFDFKCVYFESP